MAMNKRRRGERNRAFFNARFIGVGIYEANGCTRF